MNATAAEYDEVGLKLASFSARLWVAQDAWDKGEIAELDWATKCRSVWTEARAAGLQRDLWVIFDAQREERANAFQAHQMAVIAMARAIGVTE